MSQHKPLILYRVTSKNKLGVQEFEAICDNNNGTFTYIRQNGKEHTREFRSTKQNESVFFHDKDEALSFLHDRIDTSINNHKKAIRDLEKVKHLSQFVPINSNSVKPHHLFNDVALSTRAKRALFFTAREKGFEVDWWLNGVKISFLSEVSVKDLKKRHNTGQKTINEILTLSIKSGVEMKP